VLVSTDGVGMLADTIELLELPVISGTMRLDEDEILSKVKVGDDLESEVLEVGKVAMLKEGMDEEDEELLLEMIDVVGI